MPRTAIHTFEELPVRQTERTCTDRLCTVVCLLFTVLTFGAACVLLNLNSLYQINYPTDAENRTCGHQLPQHPYLYFTNPQSNVPHRSTQNNINRICVSACPKQGEPLLCSPTNDIRCSSSGVVFYESQPQLDRLGGYCLPTDQKLAENVLTTFNLHWKWNFLRSYDVIRITLLVALLAGVVFLVFVQFAPKMAVWTSVALTGLTCIVLAVMLLMDSSPSFQSERVLMNVVAVAILLLGLICLFYLYWMRIEIRVCSIFIESATRFLARSPCVFTYIPVYILLSLGLIALVVFEYLAFSSSTVLSREPHDIFWQTSPWTWWNILTLIQLIWGISFLRDSCTILNYTVNFNVSGNAVEWYFTHESTQCLLPAGRLFSLNFGSVALGSFLNGFLFLPELLFDLLTVPPNNKHSRKKRGLADSWRPPSTAFAVPQLTLCNSSDKTPMRTSTSLEHRIAQPPAARTTSAIAVKNQRVGAQLIEYNFFLKQIFRLTGHLWLLALIVIVGYSIDKSQLLNADVSPKALLCIFAGGYFIVTYFVLMHSDSAEGLLITYLAEDFMSHENKQQVNRIPNPLGQALRQFQMQSSHGYANL